jgi:putative endonuclease
MMAYYVYILYSGRTDTFYKGQTNNMQDRLKRHNSGSEKYTSKGVPWILLWYCEKTTRSESLKLESKLKNLTRKRLIAFMRKYSENIAGSDEMILLNHLSEC